VHIYILVKFGLHSHSILALQTMRFSAAVCTIVLASLASVQASPIEDTVENYELPGIQGVELHNDIASPGLHPSLHEDAITLHEDSSKSCGSHWYQTRCSYTCPCGWYYYESGPHKCNGLCYDSKRVGCYGSCPKNTHTYCGTCS
jgi:hypothetical protein